METLQSRQEISDTFRTALGRFSALVRPLSDEQLAIPSRCDGWTVGDVAGHFVGSIAEIAAGDLEGQGTPPVTKRQVEARKGWTGAQLADELDQAAIGMGMLLDALDDNAWNAPAGGGFNGSLGRGVEALLADAAIHADDIDVALNLNHHPTPDEVVAALSHVIFHLDEQGWSGATLAFDGVPAITLGDGAVPVTGNLGQFILAATGRGNPADFGLDETVNIYR